MLYNRGNVVSHGYVDGLDMVYYQVIEEEYQFFQASPAFIESKMGADGTQMTAAVLEVLKESLTTEEYENLRIDTKTHMLKPGWYPCIPGWHCDFVNRDANEDIQPDPEIDSQVRHFLVCSNAPTTQFMHDRHVESSGEGWKQVDAGIVDNIHLGYHDLYQVSPTEILEFDAQELHRGMPAKGSGWRYFFRASLFPKGDKRREERENHIRIQQQVYLPLGEGW